jgi:hypothetical protein
MLSGLGRIIVQKDSSGMRKRKVVAYIPLEIANDSQFPFEENTEVTVNVEPKKRTMTIVPLE